MADKRFNVSLQFVIKEIKEGEETPFFDSGALTWFDVPYPGMVMIESVVGDALDNLNDFGVDTSEVIGDPAMTELVKKFKEKLKGRKKNKDE